MQEHKPWNARIFGTRIAKARLRNAGTLDGRPSLHIISWLHLPTFTMCFMIISAIAGGVLSPGTGSINLSQYSRRLINQRRNAWLLEPEAPVLIKPREYERTEALQGEGDGFVTGQHQGLKTIPSITISILKDYMLPGYLFIPVTPPRICCLATYHG